MNLFCCARPGERQIKFWVNAVIACSLDRIINQVIMVLTPVVKVCHL